MCEDYMSEEQGKPQQVVIIEYTDQDFQATFARLRVEGYRCSQIAMSGEQRMALMEF